MKNIFCILVAVCVLAGCSNTLDGAGRDIEKAGQSIQKTF